MAAVKPEVAISRHPLDLRCPNLMCGVYGGHLKIHPQKIQNGRRQTGSRYIAASVGPTMSTFGVWGLWRTHDVQFWWEWKHVFGMDF